MIIGGLQKFSLLDYPDHISAIIFTQGCNFRCQFCYNPMLVWPETAGEVKYTTSSNEEEEKGHTHISEDDLFRFLNDRLGKLQAIVITGGEPTLHQDLPEFVRKIKNLGFKVKLDTNGTNPKMLEKLIHTSNTPPVLSQEGTFIKGNSLVDYIAMDLKAPEDKYELVTGVKVNFKNIEKSVKIIKESKLPYEFRTTVVPGLIDKQDIEEMGKIIGDQSSLKFRRIKWYLQKFKSDIDLVNKDYQGKDSFTDKDMEEMAEIGRQYVGVCEVR